MGNDSERRTKRKGGLFTALFLIFVGVVFLLSSFDLFSWGDTWPLFLIGIGLLLFFSAFGKRDKGAVFPGTILILVGLFFFLWRNYYLPWYMDEVWPVFPLIVGIAFFVLFLLNPRDWGVLIPAAILLFVSAVFFLNNFGALPWSVWGVFGRAWPIVLIVIGVFILLGHARRGSS